MSLEIVGAGMAGLLAANMLRHHDPFITEIQSSLPNNHSAVLRFRKSEVGDVLNIPFRRVTLTKDTLPWKNPIADALAYSFKCTGTYRTDRSVIAGRIVDERYIAPSDLIQRMARDVKINFGKSFEPSAPVQGNWFPVISTLPMPMLMQLLKYPVMRTPEFSYIEGLNVRASISGCDAYASLIIPNPYYTTSRISITGDELIIEVPRFRFLPGVEDLLGEISKNLIETACALLGFDDPHVIGDVSWYRQRYAKIMPIDDDMRKDFIHWATDTHGIFSLGRFATWRPGLLLDDLVNDIRLIDRWIGRKDRYAVARHR